MILEARLFQVFAPRGEVVTVHENYAGFVWRGLDCGKLGVSA